MTDQWVARKCPLCGTEDQSRVFAESNVSLDELDGFAFSSRKVPEYMHHRLLECSTCGMLYGSPVLAQETLAKAYHAAEFDSGNEARYASATYARQVSPVLRALPDRDAALDIGTGDGAFLEQLLALGFRDVRGVEPSAAPVAAAKPSIRPLISTGMFQEGQFPPASFSLISCFQTLEHVWDPVTTVQTAHGLLKTGGAFLAVVHNRKAFSAKLLGMKSPIFDVEHLQLFCPSTGRKLLEQAGFRDVRVMSFWNRYPAGYWLRLLPLSKRMKPSLSRILMTFGMSKAPIPLPAGNLVCIGFK